MSKKCACQYCRARSNRVRIEMSRLVTNRLKIVHAAAVINLHHCVFRESAILSSVSSLAWLPFWPVSTRTLGLVIPEFEGESHAMSIVATNLSLARAAATTKGYATVHLFLRLAVDVTVLLALADHDAWRLSKVQMDIARGASLPAHPSMHMLLPSSLTGASSCATKSAHASSSSSFSSLSFLTLLFLSHLSSPFSSIFFLHPSHFRGGRA